MIVHVNSAAIRGMNVKGVEIEVNLVPPPPDQVEQQGPTMIVVGLPDMAIRESRERVWGAVQSSNYRMPRGKTIVNLAPADLHKSGSAYDLPMALGVLQADGQLACTGLDNAMIIGELAMSGQVRGIQGALAVAMYARDQGLKRMLVPAENAKEAALASGIEVFGVNSLADAVDVLQGRGQQFATTVDIQSIYTAESMAEVMDFVDVKGQESAKRAITVAAAGNHNLLMIGSPGCGKSMIARRLPGILPLLDVEEALEVTKIYSIAGLLDGKKGLMVRRPFRSPHHTVSDAGLVGGSANPRPGELSLAHNGVLFLDELPEFRRNTLEVLRQPLETGEVVLARASGTFTFPARVMLVAAMNPCPCGYYGHPRRPCHCTAGMIMSYRSRISGPLIDRVDMHIELAPLDSEMLTQKRCGEDSATIRAKVIAAREIQRRRYAGTGIRDNASLSGKMMDQFCELDMESATALQSLIMELQLSARAYDRILRVARTLADLDGLERIERRHVQEAANYRILDRQQW